MERVQPLLSEAGLDCYIACTPVSMGYLAGFFESGGERFLIMAFAKSGERAMIVPALSETHAMHTGIEDMRTWSDGEDPMRLFEELAREWSLKTAVIGVDDEMPAGFLLPMQKVLPAALFKCAGDEMAKLRKVKDESELRLMKEAADIADAAFAEVLSRARPGMPEAELQKILLAAMMDGGGVPTFCIVAAGANGAEPHHATSDYKIQSGDVVVLDWGCSRSNYLSDVTRTICIGRASDEAKEVYRAVYRAHMAARSAIYPETPCEDIDAAAREVIENAGFGKYFVHRTGHGIGLMGHEPPHIVKGSKSLLEPGQCFSVEPGIYLPGKFGVRIENIVAVTKDGHESFNQEPSPELIEVGV